MQDIVQIKGHVTLYVNGKSVPPGEVVALNRGEAEYLAGRDLVEVFEATAPAPATIAPPPPPPTVDEEDIIEAILQLDEATGFTTAGLPKVELLEEILETNISASQRDAAWAKVQAQIGQQAESQPNNEGENA
jgi:hypothetical protein